MLLLPLFTELKKKNVDETLSLEPLTDYSKFKVQCEKILQSYTSEKFETVIVRPATVGILEDKD